jgi:hypothetical protein
MVSVLASNTVDRWLEPRSGQVVHDIRKAQNFWREKQHQVVLGGAI